MVHPRVEHLKKISRSMDSQFRGPFGIRFGWDALVGLIPGIGDLLTSAVSFYIVVQAASLGCPASTLLRMGLNILFENLIDLIPLIGNVFDFFWKANLKNISLLESHLENPRKTTIQSRILIFAVFAFFIAAFVGLIILTIYVLDFLLGLFTS